MVVMELHRGKLKQQMCQNSRLAGRWKPQSNETGPRNFVAIFALSGQQRAVFGAGAGLHTGLRGNTIICFIPL